MLLLISNGLIPRQLHAENADEMLGDVSGILVPGGFGSRGIEGKIEAIHYARTTQDSVPRSVPWHAACHRGICPQCHRSTKMPTVWNWIRIQHIRLSHMMPDQDGIEDIGGTLRLGSYPCVLDKTSKAYELYGTEEIHERHRHRYEVNNDYRDATGQPTA